MSVQLSERAIDAVVALLTDDTVGLTVELAAIDSDRADGVTMAAPADAYYFKYPRVEAAASSVHVEVFEDGFEIRHPYIDSNNGRASFDCPVTVRVIHFNNDGDTTATMITRMRRYMAGVYNVIAKNPNGLSGDGAAGIKLYTALAVQPAWELDDEDESRVIKIRAEILVEVKIEECQ